MFPVPKREEVHGRVHELVLHRVLHTTLSHPSEPEGVKHVRLRVSRVVRMRRHRRRGDERALRYTRPVGECDVFDRLAEDVHWLRDREVRIEHMLGHWN